MIAASGLLTLEEKATAGDQGVLNGIACNAEDDTFLITGKLWPKTFEVGGELSRFCFLILPHR